MLNGVLIPLESQLHNLGVSFHSARFLVVAGSAFSQLKLEKTGVLIPGYVWSDCDDNLCPACSDRIQIS